MTLISVIEQRLHSLIRQTKEKVYYNDWQNMAAIVSCGHSFEHSRNKEKKHHAASAQKGQNFMFNNSTHKIRNLYLKTVSFITNMLHIFFSKGIVGPL